jgi:hypothetical protein
VLLPGDDQRREAQRCFGDLEILDLGNLAVLWADDAHEDEDEDNDERNRKTKTKIDNEEEEEPLWTASPGEPVLVLSFVAVLAATVLARAAITGTQQCCQWPADPLPRGMISIAAGGPRNSFGIGLERTAAVHLLSQVRFLDNVTECVKESSGQRRRSPTVLA